MCTPCCLAGATRLDTRAWIAGAQGELRVVPRGARLTSERRATRARDELVPRPVRTTPPRAGSTHVLDVHVQSPYTRERCAPPTRARWYGAVLYNILSKAVPGGAEQSSSRARARVSFSSSSRSYCYIRAAG